MTVESSPPRPLIAPETLGELRAALPQIARRTVVAVTSEVPAYSRDTLGGDMGLTIEGAVEIALATFLGAARGRFADTSTPLEPALDAAYRLGRGEARSGRTMEALLRAHRVGARVGR